MGTVVEKRETDIYDRFFGPVMRGQTYLNILYLLLSFPLGIFYFTFLVTGLSLGLGLLVIWVGIPILLLVLACWWGMMAFERNMAIHLLHVDIPPMSREPVPPEGLWEQLKAALGNPVTWKGLLYLLFRFPLGILFFVVVVTWFSVTAGLVSAPFLLPWAPVHVESWALDNWSNAFLAAFIGIIIGFAGLHVMNGLAYVSGQFARVMLGSTPRAAIASVEKPALPAEQPPSSEVSAASAPKPRRRSKKASAAESQPEA